MTDEAPPSSVPLTLEGLMTPDALVALGSLVAKGLVDRSQICFFLALDGTVQLAPICEVHLDSLAEDAALAALLSWGYEDAQLVRYLRSREARLAHAELEIAAQKARKAELSATDER